MVSDVATVFYYVQDGRYKLGFWVIAKVIFPSREVKRGRYERRGAGVRVGKITARVCIGTWGRAAEWWECVREICGEKCAWRRGSQRAVV